MGYIQRGSQTGVCVFRKFAGTTLLVMGVVVGVGACATLLAGPSAAQAPVVTPPVRPPTAHANPWSRIVRAENARPGTAGATISSTRGKAAGLAAYADRVSVLPGEDVGLYVSTAVTEKVAVRALRVGYYAGLGFRSVWAGSFVAHPQRAASTLTTPLSDAGGARSTNARIAPWTVTTVLSTSGWPEGMYVLRLDAGKASRYVLLTVRSAETSGRLLLLDSPLTWEAYNTWGGRSLYGDESKSFSRRSTAVSFDRPYDDGYGAGKFFTNVISLVREAEKLGLPLAWATDYDVALDPSLIRGSTGIVVGGHAEYWTAVERDAVVAEVRRGTNLAVFGANTAYWRVRLAGRKVALAAQPSRRDGRPRIVFGPKDSRLDPLASTDPSGATARFRDRPAARSEAALTGLRYDCFPARADWVVSDASWWGYAGTGLVKGSRLTGVVGPESDRVYPAADRPKPEQVVAYTTFTCRGATTAHTGVYWTNPAGAGVFNAGSIDWQRSLTVGTATRAIGKITDNVLARFAVPLAGAAHPATDTVGRYWLPTSSTTSAS